MAVLRDSPYHNFNFKVALGGSAGDGAIGAIEGGFFEAILPSAAIGQEVVTTGNERIAGVVRKSTPGQTTYGELVLRRGIVGSLSLWEWFRSARDGSDDRRNVTVTLLDERKSPVLQWKFTGCLPVRYTGPHLNSRSGAGLAIEEIVLSVQSFDIE